MAQHSALNSGAQIGGRIRVRTPGKYIVMWLFGPVALVAAGAGYWLNFKTNQFEIAALEYRTGPGGLESAFFNLPEFLVDLSPDKNGRTAYLKMNAVVQLGDEQTQDTAAALQEKQLLVIERLTFFLRELRPEDFRGSAQIARVKHEMVRRINLIVGSQRIDDVIIEDIVIQ